MSSPTTESARSEVRRLVSLATEGDHAAYARLVEHYRESLFGLALRILRRGPEAEDAVQEAFIKAYVHLDSYDDSYSFYTWISAILTNVCYSTLRARDWQVASMPDGLLRVMRAVDRREDPELSLLLASRNEVLRAALHALPEKYREVLTLRYWSDLSYQEVADATGLTLGAVKTQIRRATLMLRETLMGMGPELLTEGA
ncbi:MAG TPA: sigma-70 family RNA polymerase sigma factor [Chloroflexota bacterium]|nr:sigma-70 family RNA polymerase sigma factor [Chloroflexota bacterium]